MPINQFVFVLWLGRKSLMNFWAIDYLVTWQHLSLETNLQIMTQSLSVSLSVIIMSL